MAAAMTGGFGAAVFPQDAPACSLHPWPSRVPGGSCRLLRPGADAEHTGLRGAAVKRHLFLLFQPQRPHHVRAGRHLKRTPPLGGCQAVPGVCSEASKVFQMGKWVLRVGDPSL